MPDKPGLADLFDEEPPNKTMLVIRGDGEDPRIIWRDDTEAAQWPGLVGERWFDGPGDPMMLGAILADATKVYAVVPLESTNLVWLVNPRPGVPSDLPPGATTTRCDDCHNVSICPECHVCPYCSGDGHVEGCPNEGDEYTAEQRAAINALNISSPEED